jgi:PAS domain S-box-containing protein
VTTAALSHLEQELADARRRIRQLEQRLAEQREVTQSRERMLATVVDHAPVILWSVDREGNITLSEGRGLAALGLTPGESLGQSMFAMYRDQPAILDQLRRGLLGEAGTYVNEVRGTWFETWMAPMRDAEGAIVGVIGVSTDVTARHRAEQAQRALGERFQQVFQSSPAGTIITELESGRFVDVNPAFCALTGYRPEELIGRTAVELGFWPDSGARRAVLSPALDGATVCRAEHRVRTRDGRLRVLRFAAERIDIDGRACLLTVMNDATQEKRWELALRRSRRRYRQLARFAPVGIFRANRSGGWSYVNRQLSLVWGCPQTELRGDGWMRTIHPEDRDHVESAYRNACASAASLVLELRICPRADTVCWVVLRMEADEHGGAFLGTATDITHRVQAAQQLTQLNADLESRVNDRTAMLVRTNQMLQEQIFERRRVIDLLEESREHWRSLVEHAPDVIMQVRRDHTIGFINHTRPRPSLTPERVVGQSVLSLVLPEFHAQVARDLNRVFDHGESVFSEVAAPDDAGETRWFENQLSPIVHNDRVTGATVVCRDVTEIKRAAEELKQTQDQLSHVARVTSAGEMAAALAHELNQPLAAIAHFVGGCMIRLQTDGGAAPEILQTLEESVDEAHRASEVIRRLRQFLQRHEQHCESVLLNDVVEDALKLAELAIRRHQTEVVVRLSPDLPIVVVDRVQLIQVVLNLVLNAVESMADNGERPRRLTVETALSGAGQVEVRVSDTGPGLPADLGESIFDAFVTTKPGGLGMGLSICRTIVETHQGSLACRTLDAPRGAQFLLSLPVVETRTLP